MFARPRTNIAASSAGKLKINPPITHNFKLRFPSHLFYWLLFLFLLPSPSLRYLLLPSLTLSSHPINSSSTVQPISIHFPLQTTVPLSLPFPFPSPSPLPFLNPPTSLLSTLPLPFSQPSHFRPEGHNFESHSRRLLRTLGKSFTRNYRHETPTQYPYSVGSASEWLMLRKSLFKWINRPTIQYNTIAYNKIQHNTIQY